MFCSKRFLEQTKKKKEIQLLSLKVCLTALFQQKSPARVSCAPGGEYQIREQSADQSASLGLPRMGEVPALCMAVAAAGSRSASLG